MCCVHQRESQREEQEAEPEPAIDLEERKQQEPNSEWEE